MKRNKHTEEQIIAILKEHEAGMKTARADYGLTICFCRSRAS